MVFGFLKRIKQIFKKKKRQFKIEFSYDKDRLWVNGEEGCVLRIQGLRNTVHTIQGITMVDIRFESMVEKSLNLEDLIDEL